MEKNPVKLDIPLTDPIVIGPLEVAMLAESLQLDIGKLKGARYETRNLQRHP